MEPSEAARQQDGQDENDCPPRPRHEGDLKFKRQHAVQWFSPNVLADASLRVLISSAFGAFLDKRELQASVATEPLVHRVQAHGVDASIAFGHAAGDVWIDFIADTGDGFNATYTVAWLASQPDLTPANLDQRLPRGDLLVLGGDEVYPVGNPDAYENRLRRPYEAALPWLPRDNPVLYAIPGNHDWYDGLTSFFRVFCQQRWIGGRSTSQTRSYFAIQLPHGWWIWGIDIQLDSYVDEPQKEYFKAVNLRKGDRVILCTATPSWYEGPESQAYRNLDFVEKTLITPRGARLVLCLSGDSHHYAHYDGGDGTHKVTAGGGGAFLHPTHPLGTKPLRLAMSQEEGQRYEQAACYPGHPTSRLLASGALSLPLLNPTFMVIPGLVYVLLAWSSQFSLRAFGDAGSIGTTAGAFGAQDVLVGLFRNPVSVLMVVVFALGLFGFAKPSPRRKKTWERNLLKVPMATFHLALHMAAVVAASLLAAKVASWWFDGGWQYTLRLLIAMGVLGGLFGGLVTGLYLAVCCAGFNSHGNEAFSAMRLASHKNFLRIRLDRDGGLTIYPIGIRRSRRWVLDPDNSEKTASWLKPKRARPVAHLIEDPFRVGEVT
jgi:hypothetical protein